MKKRLILTLTITLLLIPTIVLAKGSFDYIEVKGPGITGNIVITNPALTEDFFAFADFSAESIPAPADAGQGYEVIRVYLVDEKDHPFDMLHYYPYTGYVYYDGLAEGESEYEGKWFIANPAADEPFRSALAERARLTWIPFAALIVILVVFFIAYRGKPASK